jgi:hypothetical protein
MGGFTRPRDLRVTNWMPGGRYLDKGKRYEEPVREAYAPTTVFLIQSRYFVRHGLGRVNSPEYIVGFCPANQFKRYLRMINSGWAGDSLFQAMDNACWPGIAEGINLKPTKWWKPGENPDLLRQASLNSDSIPAPSSENAVSENVATSTDASSDPSTTSTVDETKEDDGAFESDDDDLAEDLARIEQARQLRKAKVREMIKSGATSKEVGNYTSVPFDPTRVLHTPKVAKPPPKLTAQQLEYVTNKAKLRYYAKYLSHSPEEHWIRVDESDSGFDEKLHDPNFVDTVLAGTPYQYRKRYIPTLAEQPFWRPVLAVTFPTRPLGRVVARLSKALPRGLPYYASMPSEDLKCKKSLPSRTLNLRLTRMRRLTIQTAERLAGYFGGFPGIRFDSRMPGRAVNGTLLEAPLTEEQRRIVALVADWYSHSTEEIDGYQKEGRVFITTGLMDALGNPQDSTLSIRDDDAQLLVESSEGDRGGEEHEADSDSD